MESQLFTLSKIFTERLFRIPDYQRGYAWTEDQLKDFWNDIDQIEDGRNHYTGVLTLEEVPNEARETWVEDNWIVDARGYEALYIVDGQQRLTTSIILIQCILDATDETTSLNYTPRDQIKKKFICDTKDQGISVSYIFGYEKDNPSYEFLKTQIFEDYSSTNRYEETIYTNNLANAKKFFSEKIAELKIEEIEALYRKVTQRLLFNIFTISDEVDVCVSFETMNNRGKPLSDLELLKNRLIYLSLKLNVEDSEKMKLRREINECWKSIYHNLGRNKDNPLKDDDFLNSHFVLYFVDPISDSDDGAEGDSDLAEVQRNRRRFLRRARGEALYSPLLESIFITKRISEDAASPGEAALDLNEIYKYVKSLQSAVSSWYRIFNPADTQDANDVEFWLGKLNRLNKGGASLVLSALMNIKDEADQVEIFKNLERHLFLSSLGDRFHYQREFIDSSFLDEAIKLHRGAMSSKQVSKSISEHTSNLLKSAWYLEELRKGFLSGGFYGWRDIRYFLYEYNLSLQIRSKTERRKISWPALIERSSDYKSVEHIFPQNARAKYWTDRFSGLSQKQRDHLRNAIGNLLPLSTPKNSSLSNRPFPEKVSGKNDEVVGYQYGCYAENEVAKEKEWTQEAILSRSLKMLRFMENRWNFKLGSEADMIKMLGLEFVSARMKS